jgi:FtsX-like permease family
MKTEERAMTPALRGALFVSILMLAPAALCAQDAGDKPADKPEGQASAAEQPKERSTGLPSQIKWVLKIDAGWGSFGFANSLFNNPKEPGVDENLSDQWFEGYVKPALSATYTLDSSSVLYGKISAVGERTYGSVPAVGNSRTIRTMVQALDEELTPQRFSALLLGLFAGVALLLAAVGIYSVLSYIVRGRSREIGIRAALGARTADVLRLVIVEGMSPTLVGIAAGTIAALAPARVMETLVFGASDPLTLAAVAATLALVALMASLVPAYRALRVDPVKVLRATH